LANYSGLWDWDFTLVGLYEIDLTGLDGGAAVVFASGFLSPADNQDGEPFGLFAALPNGTVVELPRIRSASQEAAALEAIEAEPKRGDTPSMNDFGLEQNRPNPFNPVTTISFTIPSAQHVSLKVYDVAGREVATIVNGTRPAGHHTVNFEARNIASGIYFYRLKAGDFLETRKMILLR
jgi:hypothetical protein